jgi:hypothetical protein
LIGCNPPGLKRNIGSGSGVPDGVVGVIRFSGRIDYVDPVSPSLAEESLQGLGGVGFSGRRPLVIAGEHPVEI